MVIGLLVDTAYKLLMDLECKRVSTVLNERDKKIRTRQTQPRLQGVHERVDHSFGPDQQPPYCRGWPCRSGRSAYSRA